MIVGTAGHVDHGKSALVAALTGAPVDRLAEERARGMTIALGFAPLMLPDGRVAGVVDVPGHENLIRTMVAGASGMDVVLLVVAADEGIKPQTEEHLLILELLRVRCGVAVLSKVDRVSPERLAQVGDELAMRLAASPIPFSDPVAVSIPDGRGVAEVRRELLRLLATAPPRDPHDLFRLPIDRVFAAPGFGTVVTGSTWSGTAAVGDDVLLLPSGRRARIRSIEEFGASRMQATPSARTALALVGVAVADVAKGSVAVHPDAGWEVTRRLTVRVVLAGDTGPLLRRTRIELLHATASVSGHVVPHEPIAAGARGPASLLLDRGVVVRAGDRFVLRALSPVTIIGGGEVLDPLPGARMLWSDGMVSDDPASRLHAVIGRRKDGVEEGQLAVLSGLAPDAVNRLVEQSGELVTTGSRVIAKARVNQVADALRAVVSGWHRDRPAEPGIPLETLRRGSGAGQATTEAALAQLECTGLLEREGNLARIRGFVPSAPGGEQALGMLALQVDGAGLTPPEVAELATMLGVDLRQVESALRFAERAGRLVAVTPTRFYGHQALGRFRNALLEVGARSAIRVGAVRDATGLSRKYLIPLLEWADRAGITFRDGDVRHLVPDLRHEE
jgi:selenocysteine-specific elongation factor